MGNRTAADPERELAMLASVRDCLRGTAGEDFRIPTTAPDEVLDDLNSVERSDVIYGGVGCVQVSGFSCRRIR